MFGIKDKLENIYNILIVFNNNERKRTEVAERKAEKLAEENLKLNILVENNNEIISEKDKEIERLNSLVEQFNSDERKRLYEYLEKVAEILKNNQSKIVNRKKPSKVDLMTEKYYKISNETKEKLK